MAEQVCHRHQRLSNDGIREYCVDGRIAGRPTQTRIPGLELRNIEVEHRVGRPGICSHQLFTRIVKAVAIGIVSWSKVKISEVLEFPVVVETVAIRVCDGDPLRNELHESDRAGRGRASDSCGALITNLDTPFTGTAFVKML